MSPGPARPWSRESRQVRKEAAVNGFQVRRREARVYELLYSATSHGPKTSGRRRRLCNKFLLATRLMEPLPASHEHSCSALIFDSYFKIDTLLRGT